MFHFKTVRNSLAVLALAAGGLLTAALPAMAEYPERPITFIVPYGPGGGADIAGRALARELETMLGQPVVVENIGGGGGSVGLTRLFNAEPDGYTIGIGTGSNTTIIPHTTEIAYDPRDFTMISSFFGQPFMVLVHPSVPATNLEELQAWAKEHPGGLINSTAGGFGIQDVAAGMLAQAMGGIDYRTLPNNSGSESTMRLLSGDANLAIGTAFTLEHIKAGSIRPLAVISDTSAPEIDALGLESTQDKLGFSVSSRSVILAPPGLPAEVREKLEASVAQAVAAPALVDQMNKLGYPILFETGEAAHDTLVATYERYGPVIDELLKQ